MLAEVGTAWMIIVLAVFLLLVLGAAALVIGAVTSGRLRSLAVDAADSWADVTDLLVRRHALVRELLGALRQDAALEQRVVDLVTRDLDAAVRSGSAGAADRAERRLASSVAAALDRSGQGHPELARIDAALADLDTEIAAAGHAYNRDAAELNQTLFTFPGTTVASRSGVQRADLFQPATD